VVERDRFARPITNPDPLSADRAGRVSVSPSRFHSRGTSGLLIPAGLGAVAALFPLSALLGLFALCSAACVIVIVGYRNPALRTPLIAGFGMRAVLALVQAFVVPLPGSGNDDITFERLGWTWSTGGLVESLNHLLPGSWFYSGWIAVLYSVTDRSALMIQSINVFFGTLIIAIAYYTAESLWGVREARAAAWMVAIFPTLAMNSAITLREVAVVFPIVLGAFCLARWTGTGHVLWLLGSLLAISASISFHSGGLFLLVGAFFIVMRTLSSRRLRRMRGRLTGRCAALLMAGGAIVAILISGWGLSKFGNLGDLSLELLAMRQEVAGDSRAAYLRGLVVTHPIDLIWQTPIRMAYFLFAPFIWMVTSPADLVGLLDSALYLFLFVLVLRGWPRIRQSVPAKSLLVLTTFFVVGFSVAVSNYGTAIRHRAKIVPVVVPVAIVGLRRRLADRLATTVEESRERWTERAR